MDPFLPKAKRLGRPRTTDLREVVNAIQHLASGCNPWRAFYKDFPPASTLRCYFCAKAKDVTWLKINHALVMLSRERAGSEASPSTDVIDSQSVKTTESGGPRGHDVGKKIKGGKCHIVTDTAGHLVGLQVHPADIQDRNGPIAVLGSTRKSYPWLRHIFADGGYAGDKLKGTLAELGRWTIEIVRRCDTTKGFGLPPPRWAVARTFAWLNRYHRLAKDFAATVESVIAWTFIAHFGILTRHLARA